MIYHVDESKSGNSEDGEQTQSNHYKVALVEKDTSTLMTSSTNIYADLDDVYLLGDVISQTQTRLYDASETGYSVEIIAQDYADRTMTIRITNSNQP